MARTVIPTADLKGKKGGLRWLDGSRSMAGTILILKKQQQRERKRKTEIIIKIYH